jgi:hypothetical protein
MLLIAESTALREEGCPPQIKKKHEGLGQANALFGNCYLEVYVEHWPLCSDPVRSVQFTHIVAILVASYVSKPSVPIGVVSSQTEPSVGEADDVHRKLTIKVA